MPQIDEKDIPRLLVFAAKAGYGIRAGETLPTVFETHQKINPVKVDQMSMHPELQDKPIIVTKTFEVIDGNHRLRLHALQETLVPYIMLDLSFVEALDLLAVFPFAYELTEATPERN